MGASQNVIGSLPKFDCLLTFWSLLKLLNVMLRFGCNLKIQIEAVWEFGSLPIFGSLPKGLNDILSQEVKNA